MAHKKPNILCIDIGGDTIKAGEFAYTESGTMTLVKFAYAEYGFGEDSTTNTDAYLYAMLIELKKIIVENHFTAKIVNVSVSGQNALIRFVKIPALTENAEKIQQIIEFEAKQNAPFPLDQLIWDSQILGKDEDNAEIDAMIVNVKSTDIEKIVKIIQDTGKKVGIIEVSPSASYNACRANMIGEEQCEMILNIGGRCSTLTFIDQGNYFERTLSPSGNTITQLIAKDFGISLKEAEDMKRRHGFVALGGAYEDPDSEVAAIISKIVRNVMTRLHADINRSINAYRASQKGRRPEKLYLAGGSSVMPYTPRFFSEKLKIPVEYLNPFQIVTVGENVDTEALSEVAHIFSEVIGLGLRNVGLCPLEFYLIPEALKKQRIFNQKQPYFYASALTALLCLGITYWSFSKQLTTVKKDQNRAEQQVKMTQSTITKVDNAKQKLDASKNAYEKASLLLTNRNEWVSIFNKIQEAVPPSIWFTSIKGADSVSEVVTQKAQQNQQESGGFRGFASFDAPPERTNTSKAPTGEWRWIVFEGYIRTENPQEDATKIHQMFKRNLVKTGLFKDFTSADNDRLTQNLKLGSQDVNISSFKIEAELLKPIKR